MEELIEIRKLDEYRYLRIVFRKDKQKYVIYLRSVASNAYNSQWFDNIKDKEENINSLLARVEANKHVKHKEGKPGRPHSKHPRCWGDERLRHFNNISSYGEFLERNGIRDLGYE